MSTANSRETTKFYFKRSTINILKKERKWNHIKYSIAIREGRKRVEDKNKQNNDSEQETVTKYDIY